MNQSNLFNPDEQYGRTKELVLSSIADQFPFDGKTNRLELVRSWVDELPERKSKDKTKKARLEERHMASPVLGHVRLVDKKSGRVVDEVKRMQLARVPVPLTTTGGFLVEGSEFQIGNQERLRPGVYTRRTGAGILESQANLSRGMNFSLALDPERERITARFGTLNVGIHEFLRIMGASDKDIQQHLGTTLFDKNKVDKAKIGAAAQRLHRTLFKRPKNEVVEPVEATRQLQEYFRERTQIDPETTRATLGKEYSKVTPGLVLSSTRKLLRVAQGKEETDNRNAPHFKHFYGPEDQLDYRLNHYTTRNPIKFQVNGRLDHKDQVRQIINNRTFGEPVRRFFTESSLSNATEQNNPLSILGEANKTTVLGEGGIPSSRSVPEDARSIEPSSLHYHDPVQTPESDKVGITLHLGIDTIRQEDKTLRTRVRDQSGNPRYLAPNESFEAVVAFADQYEGRKPKNRMVSTIHRGKISERPASSVQYVYDRPQGMFSTSANLIPFLDSTQPTRALTASKQMEQAVSLVDREVPLVQVGNGRGQTFEDDIGAQFGTRAPADGTVEQAGTKEIVIKTPSGTKHRVDLWQDYPLNQNTFLDEHPIVAKGDRVRAGQPVADSNYTKGGTLALGVNLRTAYMPYYGNTFEDAVTISESAAKKMTSEHLYREDALIDDKTSLSLKKFRAHVPGVVNKTMSDKLDDDGVIRPGQQVEKDDVLVAALRQEHVTPEDTLLSRLSKSRARPWKDRSLRWSHDNPGVVTDVVRLADKVKVFVKTQEPAREGDKLVGRHGNKGIITKVLPDKDMVRDQSGQVIDLIMDPHTVPSRINIGQNLENALGKLADKLGEPQVITNFAGGHLNTDQLKKRLKDAGLSDKETLKDPRSGKQIPGIQVGKHYTLKLKHQIEKKFSARNTGGYDLNLQPKGGPGGGQSMDRLTMYAMLANDARANLREMSTTLKAEKNDDLWLRVQQGLALPKPKPTFAHDKFESLVKGMGVNIHQDDTRRTLLPLTDKDVASLSSGALPHPTRSLTRNNMMPEAGGLFDPEIVGGLRGNNWSHIELSEPLPNPVMRKGILSLTKLKGSELDALIDGRLAVNDHGTVVPAKDWS